MKILVAVVIVTLSTCGLLAQDYNDVAFHKGLTIKLNIEQISETARSAGIGVRTEGISPSGLRGTLVRRSESSNSTRNGTVRRALTANRAANAPAPLRTFQCRISLSESSGFQRVVEEEYKNIVLSKKTISGLRMDFRKAGSNPAEITDILLPLGDDGDYVFEIKDTIEARRLRVSIYNFKLEAEVEEVHSKQIIDKFTRAKSELDLKLSLYNREKFTNPTTVPLYEKKLKECRDLMRELENLDFAKTMKISESDKLAFIEDFTALESLTERLEKELESLNENLHVKMYEYARSARVSVGQRKDLMDKALQQAKLKGIVYLDPYFDLLQRALNNKELKEAEELLRGIKASSSREVDGIRMARMAEQLLELSLEKAKGTDNRRLKINGLEQAADIADKYYTASAAAAIRKEITDIHSRHFSGLLGLRGFLGTNEAKEYAREYGEHLSDSGERILKKTDIAYEEAMDEVMRDLQGRRYEDAFNGLKLLSEARKSYGLSSSQASGIDRRIDELYLGVLDQVDDFLKLEEYEPAMAVLKVADRCQREWVSERFDQGNVERARIPVLNGLVRQYGEKIEVAVNGDDYETAKGLLDQVQKWRDEVKVPVPRADEIIANSSRTLVLLRADLETEKLAAAPFGREFEPTIAGFAKEYERQQREEIGKEYTNKLLNRFSDYFWRGYDDLVSEQRERGNCDTLKVKIPDAFANILPRLTKRVTEAVRRCQTANIQARYARLKLGKSESLGQISSRYMGVTELRTIMQEHGSDLRATMLDSVNRGLEEVSAEICESANRKIAEQIRRIKDMIAIERYTAASRLAAETYDEQLSILDCTAEEYRNLLDVSARSKFFLEHQTRMKSIKSGVGGGTDRMRVIREIRSLDQYCKTNDLSRFGLSAYTLNELLSETEPMDRMEARKDIVRVFLSEGWAMDPVKKNILEIIKSYGEKYDRSGARDFADEVLSYLPASGKKECLKMLMEVANGVPDKTAAIMYKAFKKEYKSVRH